MISLKENSYIHQSIRICSMYLHINIETYTYVEMYLCIMIYCFVHISVIGHSGSKIQ
jgi:hypothetical protein